MKLLLKILFIHAALLIGMVATAGEKPSAKTKPPYVPRHEVTVSASLAYNSYLYSVQPGEDKGLKRGSYLDEFSFFACIFPFDLTYTYHFDKHWGITTGVGFHAFATAIEETGRHVGYTEGTYPLPTVDTDPPTFMETSPIGMKYKFKEEDNSMTQVLATVPVLAQYMLPFGNGSWNFYVQGGLKLGIHLYGEKFSEVSSRVVSSDVGIYRYSNSWKTLTRDEEEEDISANPHIGTDDSDYRRINLFASLETGIRIPIWRCLGIYVGGYADLGLLRNTKVSEYPYTAYDGAFLSTLFSAREERYTISATESEYTVTAGKKGYLRGLLPISAGMKIRIAF